MYYKLNSSMLGDSLKTAKLVPGEITAYRAWFWPNNPYNSFSIIHRNGSSIYNQGPGLYSMSQGTLWVPGKPMTTMHGTDELGWQYGVYSFKKWKRAWWEYGSGWSWDMTNSHKIFCVVGTIDIWGEIVEHKKGYRSQFASIKSIDWVKPVFPYLNYNETFRLRKEIREMYGV
jgi:hypothetical protein